MPAGVAVSGGPDSMAMLLLCAAAFPGQTKAATVDHGLRPESADEAQLVSDLCDQLSVPHAILKLGPPVPGNISAWARTARYEALDRWANENGIAAILTAHHADDQLETIIMRLNRGSGVAGLAAIRAQQGRIVRPLLDWRHDELVEIVAACGVTAVDDPSNRDDRFDRARIRNVLTDAKWLDPIAASRSASALADAETALEWMADTVFADRVNHREGVFSLDPRDLPAELVRRLVLRCLSIFDPEIAPRGDELQRLIGTLKAGGTATLGKVRCRSGERWTFAPAPPRRKI